LVFAPCVHRARLAPLRTTAHAGPTGSCVAVSLWRDVPLPACNRTLTQLGQTCLIGSSIWRRSWDFSALRSVPRPRVPAFVTHICGPFNCRCASPPFIPTCRYQTHPAPLIFTGAGRAESELLPREASFLRATDCGMIQPAPGCCYRGRAEPGVCLATLRPANPAMGFFGASLGLVGCFFTARRREAHSTSPRKLADHRLPQPPSVGCHPLMGFSCDWTKEMHKRRVLLSRTRARSICFLWPAGLL